MYLSGTMTNAVRLWAARARPFGFAVVTLAAAISAGCRPGAGQPPKAAPLSQTDTDALRAYVRYSKCVPTSCDKITCEPFSDGTTRKTPAHIALCRWLDDRNKPVPERCAYVHYSYDAGRQGFKDLFISAPATGTVCQHDPAFSESMTGLGYSGAVP